MSSTTVAETLAVSQASLRHLPLQFLTFRLGAEEYGIDLLLVQEIRSFEPPTRIAGADVSCLGVINLRDVIVPVIDLRIKLRLTEVPYDANTVVVVLNLQGTVVGAVVDSVCDVPDLEAAQIKPAPDFNSDLPDVRLLGLAPLEGTDGVKRMLILLDVERLLQSVATAQAATAA